MAIDEVVLNNIIKRLREYHDSSELVSLLEIEPYELLEAFEDKVIYNIDKFINEEEER